MFDDSAARSNTTGQSVVLSQLRRAGVYGDFAKRALDIALVVLSLPFVVPLLLVLMVVSASDGCNPLYSQRRGGRYGRQFTIWKLRTMVPNADAVLRTYLAGDPIAAQEWETTQKLKRDPRITAMGRVLRKTSLDELPQLFNVLKGEMSLVGPRPMMPEQQKMYPGGEYYALRPGLTGTWQISDRNNSTFAARARFDAEYHQQMSFGTDCKILAATVGVVVRGTGY